MSSYRQIYYHLIFGTKRGEPTLNQESSHELYAYFTGIIRNKNCHLYRINGMEDHIHIFSDLHPSIALAAYLQDIKTASSLWLKDSPKFPLFKGWAKGSAAITYCWRDKDMIINYIKNQQTHHKKESFEEELRRILIENGIEIDERYFP